eukprot:881671-Pyramimonas_sp.AAC.1
MTRTLTHIKGVTSRPQLALSSQEMRVSTPAVRRLASAPTAPKLRRAPHRPRLVRGIKSPTTAAYDRDFALNGDTIYQEAQQVAERSPGSLRGKTVLITGANSGIGKEAARVLGETCGATVLLACRTAKSASDTAKELSTSSSGDFIPIMHPLDLGDLKCVKETASMILKEYLSDGKPLDVLLCNAGLAGVPN